MVCLYLHKLIKRGVREVVLYQSLPAQLDTARIYVCIFCSYLGSTVGSIILCNFVKHILKRFYRYIGKAI